MAIDIWYARISPVPTNEHDYLITEDEQPEIVEHFKDYIRSKHFEFTDESYDLDVLYYETLYLQTGGVLGSYYETYESEFTLLRLADIVQLIPHLKENYRDEFKRNVIDKFSEGLEMVISSY